jgi:hypothetical protein
MTRRSSAQGDLAEDAPRRDPIGCNAIGRPTSRLSRHEWRQVPTRF